MEAVLRAFAATGGMHRANGSQIACRAIGDDVIDGHIWGLWGTICLAAIIRLSGI